MPSSAVAPKSADEVTSQKTTVGVSREARDPVTTPSSESCDRILLVGFDSAWTAHNKGGLVAVIRETDGSIKELGDPRSADYPEASRVIRNWRASLEPAHTLILLDQPTIVRNATGQRPVEGIAGSPIGRHGGGMQPANTSKAEMFGADAPVWEFLAEFGGAVDPLEPVEDVAVFETYPSLALIGLDWLRPSLGAISRLPKYNPANRAKFSLEDWRSVCGRAGEELQAFGLVDVPRWLDELADLPAPRKAHQDGLDACLCLVVALHLVEQKTCLMVGDMSTGFIVVPHGDMLARELTERCPLVGCDPLDWVHEFCLTFLG